MREAAIKSHALESKNTQIWVWVIVLGSVISLQVAEQLEHRLICSITRLSNIQILLFL